MVYYVGMLRSTCRYLEKPPLDNALYSIYCLSEDLETLRDCLSEKIIRQVQTMIDESADPMMLMILSAIEIQLAASGREHHAQSLPPNQVSQLVSSFEEIEDFGSALQLVERALLWKNQSPRLPSVDRKLYIQMFVRLRQAFQSGIEKDGEFWEWLPTDCSSFLIVPPDYLKSSGIYIPFEVIQDVHDFDAFADAGGLELRDSLGRTILHDLAQRPANSDTRCLLDYVLASSVLNVDELGYWEAAPLHVACSSGNITAVEALLEHNADPNLQGSSNNTPLHYAALAGDESICRLLLSASEADPNLTNFDDEKTPLHLAAESGWEPIVILLLNHEDHPVYVNKIDGNGHTPLDLAEAEGHESIVWLLYGATRHWDLFVG